VGAAKKSGSRRTSEGSPGRQIDCFWLRFTKKLLRVVSLSFRHAAVEVGTIFFSIQ
jgi:hypothetical protein